MALNKFSKLEYDRGSNDTPYLYFNGNSIKCYNLQFNNGIVKQQLDLNNKPLLNVPTPINATDGVNKKYVDSLKVNSSTTSNGDIIALKQELQLQIDRLNNYISILSSTYKIYDNNNNLIKF